MGKKTTSHNTGLTLKRTRNKFTASWKIKTDKMDTQKIRYRTNNGSKWSSWTTKKVGKKATSYSFTLSASATITKIQVQTQVLRSPTSSYKASDWDSSSYKYDVEKPLAPTLTVANEAANSTTFTWSAPQDKDNHWYYRCLYRTKYDSKPEASTGWSAWAPASQSSYSYTDNETGKTRSFQIKAVGPGGESATKTQRHNITTSPVATWGKDPVSIDTKSSQYYKMVYNVNLNASHYTVDSIVPQYFIGKPDADMSCPGNAGWSDGTTYHYADGKSNYALAITTEDRISEDECLWARVKTAHDSIPSASSAYRVLTGKLKKPSANISPGTPATSGFTVSFSNIDAKTQVEDAYIEVYLEKYSAMGIENYILIGTIANGSATAEISCSEDITGEEGFAIHIRNVTADGHSMKSDYYDYSTSMPSAPTLISVDPTATAGKVYLSWITNWTASNGTIIAWTDDPDNWRSNEEPETYEINEDANSWFITGLETGKTWYFRIRSVMTSGDNVTYSPWSSDEPIDLSSAPAIPVLYLSEETIAEDGMVTAYWSYVSTDGTSQIAANVVEVTVADAEWDPNARTWSGGNLTYGDPVGSATSEQHIDIYASDHGWENGSTVYLALQTQSGSGGFSDYSSLAKLVIAPEPAVTITDPFTGSETTTEYFAGDGSTRAFRCAGSLSASPTVTVGGAAATVSGYSGDTVTLASAPADGAEVAITYTTTDNRILGDLPLSVTVSTTGATNLTVAIERAVKYPLERPDGTVTDGAAGETIYVSSIPAESSNIISIGLDDLIGRLDDGAWYNLVATASNNYGHSAEDSIMFKVHWSHQAWKPEATFVSDPENYIARITPVASEDYETGDTCDIYRLGIDKPELIISGGAFGTEYVDPYPAFGASSGYKVVTVTANGDYITEDNMFAEYDSTIEEDAGYTQLDPKCIVIDFAGERVELPYNITLGNSWAKDFERTQYLGGHVAGDHNKAVIRDLSASTVLAVNRQYVDTETMRSLSEYAGLCHVRTPEGSSFVADIQVSEDREYGSPIVSYNLTIKKVDTVGFDGMTYAEWSELQ